MSKGKVVDRPQPERKTCSVTEFARIVGIGDHAAKEIVEGDTAPDGFWVGSRYRVRIEKIDAWLDSVCTMRPQVRFCRNLTDGEM